MKIMIRPANLNDAAAICRIYNHYVLNTTVSFEEEAVETAQMQERIRQTQAENLPWLVLEVEGQVQGYAYAAKWRARRAYRFCVETSVYCDQTIHGKGLGKQLYLCLLQHLREMGFTSAFAGIALPNPVSIALHEKLGFNKVAHFSEVGFKDNRWIDVGSWQLKLQ